ncbi:MAG: carboxylesterase family protein, partial [Treponema sp.]|nr:carboxylesterase family protein [Treponema sp.]
KGIPFAKPPVGKLRFAPPQKAEPWEGVRECYKFSAVCPQADALVNPPDDDLYGKEWCVDTELPMDDDCLYLNVWTPARKSDEKLPVYFWIFGGGWQVGNASEMEFDGERIARRGIVVVTINYRVNLFGFTCHKDITKEYPDNPANFGLQDQQMALKWVSRNIAAFGGDPDNITIGGQSAGGGSVIFHIENPESRKYFKRAVVESGLFVNPFRNVFPRHTVADAEKLGEEFFEFCGVKSLEEARALPVSTLMQKWSDWGGFFKSVQTWVPVSDGKFMRDDLIDRVEKDGLEPPPLLIGYTPDEFLEGPVLGNKEGQISMVELGLRKLIMAEEKRGLKAKNYVYQFAVPIPGWDNPGDFHSVDLWFFFETLAKCWRPFKGYHYDMARHICDYLCNFVKTGNPNDSGENKGGVRYIPVKDEFKKREAEEKENLPAWKPFTTEDPECMFFESECRPGKLEPSAEIKKYL